MNLIITETVGSLATIETLVTNLTIAPFDVGAGAVPLSTVLAAGDLIIGTGSGAVTRLGTGSTGTALVSNGVAVAPSWQAVGGGGSSTLTNQSGADVAAGDVLIFDAGHDSAFATTTVSSDARVLGVAGDVISAGASGAVYSIAGSKAVVNCDTAAVSRGDWLVSSSSLGKATSAGSYKPAAGFAIAMTAKSAGSSGTVTAMIMPQIPFAVGGTKSYMSGGFTAGGATSETQRFTFASATWATVGGAALPANRYTCGAVSNTTANGWTVGGDSGGGLQTTAYNLSYSTETYSTVGTAALSVARQFIPYGSHSSLSGYMCGGANAGGQTNIFKLLYSSSVTSTLGAVISSGRWSGAAVSDGTYSYIEGGTTGSDVVTADKLNMTNDTCAANAGSNLTVAKSGTMSMTYPAIAGYIAQQSFTNKVTFASSIASNVGGVISTVIQYAAGISDGNGLGYVSGGNGAINVTNSFTRATETFATAVPSNLITGKSQAAVFNNGAF